MTRSAEIKGDLGDARGAGPGRARRAVAAAAKALGLGVVFVAAAAGSVILHLGLPAPRRFAATQVNGILEGTFKGKIVIGNIGSLRLGQIQGVDASIYDPEGHLVLALHGVHARFGALTLLRSLVSGGDVIVNLPAVTIDAVEAVLEENAAGELGLVRAFDARTPSSGSSGGAEVSIPKVLIRHAWVHGHLAAAPVLDVDLDEVAGGFTSTARTTGIAIERLLVRGRGMPGMDPEGALAGTAWLPSDPKEATRASAKYEGRIGAIPVRAEGSLDGKVVNAVVDVAEASPEAIAALSPGRIHLGAPVSAHGEVHGVLPTLKPELRARIGAGELTGTGTVTLPEAPQTDLVAAMKLDARDLDVSLLDTSAPPSRLTALVEASVLARPGGKLTGTFHVENQVGEVSGQIVPAVSARGDFTERSARGSAEIAERGAPTTVQFDLQPRAGGATPVELEFKTKTTIANLDGIPRVGPIARGRATLSVEGRLDLDTRRIDASAAGEVSGIDRSGVRLARGFVTVKAAGPIDAPHLDAAVRGSGLLAGGYAFTSVRAGASGSPRELDVTTALVGDDKAPSIGARAHVSTGASVTVRGVGATIERGDVKSTATVASIDAADGVVDIRGVKVEGLGDPVEASARIAGATVRVKARSADIDLARVAKLLAREEDTRGHLALDVDAVSSRRGIEGHVEAQVRDLASRRIEGASVRVALTSKGNHLQGEVSAALGGVGRVTISTSDVHLSGPATAPASWQGATGAVAVDGAVDLTRLLAQIPEESRPVFAASGAVAIRGQASRASSSATPAVTLEASTSKLVLIGKQEKHRNADGSLTLGAPPFRTEGIDGTFGVKLDGSSGRADISAKVHDKAGPLVALDVGALLPIAAILRSPGQALALVRDTPLEARIDMPRRSLDALPPALGQLPLRGEVELGAAITGTSRAPKVTLTAKAMNLRARTALACVPTVDVETRVVYDGEKADVRLAVAREGSEVAGADAIVKVSAAAAIAGDPIAWEASADVALTRFPLDVASAFLEQPVAGYVSGSVRAKDLHRAASLTADLDLDAVTLDQASFPRGKVLVTMKEGSFTASARLDQSDGFAEARGTGAMKWGVELTPALDLAQPIDVALLAKNFRAKAARPFVREVFTELDGRVDADAKLRVEPGGEAGQLDGAITLREGVFEVPQIGQRFHGLEARVIMKPWGTLRLEDVSAEGQTGRLTASAEAVLKGLSLQSAKAKVVIAKGQSIPISVGDLQMGRAYGEINARAQMAQDGKRLDVTVEVPMLRVDLPQSTGHQIQPLELDPTVRVGLRSKQDFVSLPLLAPEKVRAASDFLVRADVKLGDVELKRDTTVEVQLTGQTLVEVSDQTRVSGQIRLLRGRLDVQGRQFKIDRGTVTFLGDDPADPLVIASAYWDAPDGTRVFADFSGHVTSGKLSLRSEPSLTQDEVLALILFGSSDGSFGAAAKPGQDEGVGVKAAGFAGSVVTRGLNKAISGLTSADITTRVDTSDAASPRPELAVQISRRVSARLGYKLGVPAPGENPDRTQLTLDWRFVRNWSIEAVVGDQGSTALDVVWRLRY